MKAPSKSVEASGNTLETVVSLHTEINELNTTLKVKKAEFATVTTALKDESKDIFDRDLGELGSEEAPEIFGNHEYTHEDHLVTVNYKMKAGGLSFTKIAGQDAAEVLPKLISAADYKKLFTEKEKLTVTEEELIETAKTRPDLVAYNLNAQALPEAALTLIRSKWPDAFTIVAKDEAEYIKEVEDADVSIELTTNTGFLEKAASISEEAKVKLRDLLRRVLASTVTSAVKCGNKS